MPSSSIQSERELRRQLVEVGRQLYERDYIASTDGNLSVRLGDRWMLTTPSGVHKGRLQPEQIVRCELSGRSDDPKGGRPSSEIRMHSLVYQARPEVNAAIHAHPIHAVALSLVGVSLAECLLPEATLALGSIPTAPYATPTTDDVPASITELLARRFNALILARHGTLTLGADLDQAYLRLETLEHTARITAAARAMGATKPLPAEEVERLEQIATDLGLERPVRCAGCGTCGQPPTLGQVERSGPSPQRPVAPRSPDQSQELIDQLTRAVLSRLGHGRVG